jgi:hypothetical protein
VVVSLKELSAYHLKWGRIRTKGRYNEVTFEFEDLDEFGTGIEKKL